MKHEIKKALQTIPVPDLENSVRAGIARAERDGITMTRSVKKIAAIAAVLVLFVGIVGAAAIAGRKDGGDRILTAEEVSLKFNGFNQNGTLNLSASYTATGEEVESPYNINNYTIIDENGELVATCQNDRIEYEHIGLVYYWADEEGELYFTDIYSGVYTVVFQVDDSKDIVQMEGHWEIDVDLEELNYQVFFDPRDNCYGSLEDGTAYVAMDSEITAEFVDVDMNAMDLIRLNHESEDIPDDIINGDEKVKELKININSSKEPFNDIIAVCPTTYVWFGADRLFDGGQAANPFLNEKLSFGELLIQNFDYCKKVDRNNTIYVLTDNEPRGERCTLKIYAIAIQRADGSIIEVQGDWMADFYN